MSRIRDHHNELKLNVAETAAPNRKFMVAFRAFNDGVAFRYEFPAQPALGDFEIMDELTEFTMADNARAWSIPSNRSRLDRSEQLFSAAQPSGIPTMQGFIKDYFNTLTATKNWTGSADDQSKVIMQCFAPTSIPVLSGLAQQFAVFDHWFCAVPSQTWCNRAFWHAATSWGWVNNPPLSGDAIE